MEKERLVNFISTIMDDSGFNVTKNYRVGNETIDIYGTLRTKAGEVGVVVACKNYVEPWTVGLEVVKDMEKLARKVHASKIIIFTTSSYSHACAIYAQKRNIKLVDRKGLIKIAKNYAERRNIVSEPVVSYEDEYSGYNAPVNRKPARLDSKSHGGRFSHRQKSQRSSRSSNMYSSRPSAYSNSGYTNRSRSGGHFSLSKPSVGSGMMNKMSNVNISGMLDLYENHQIIYLIILIILASAVAYLFSLVTSGPFTGLGKIITSAIICFGGLGLVERNISNLIFKAGIIFFISIIISIIITTM